MPLLRVANGDITFLVPVGPASDRAEIQARPADVYAMSVWYDKMRTHKPLSYSFVAQDIDDTILDSLYLHCVDNECTDIKVYLSVSDAHGFTPGLEASRLIRREFSLSLRQDYKHGLSSDCRPWRRASASSRG